MKGCLWKCWVFYYLSLDYNGRTVQPVGQDLLSLGSAGLRVVRVIVVGNQLEREAGLESSKQSQQL